MRSLGYNPALDGLRALAVGGVIVQHVGYNFGGYFGVTVFFVISGYLITGMLLVERGSSGTINLRGFYRRRVARLAPALLLATVAITVWLLLTSTSASQWWAGLLGTASYTTDLLLATPVAGHVSTYFEWSWSLGIEEQFYLLWPLLMIVLLRRSRRVGRAALAAGATLVIVIAWADRWHLSYGHPSHARINFTFDTHMDAIAFGALIAVLLAGATFTRPVLAIAQLAAAVSAVLLLLIMREPWLTNRLTVHDLSGYGQVAVLCALLVMGLVVAPNGLFSRLLAMPPLVYLGKLSYGLYLWNILLMEMFDHVTGHMPAHSGIELVGWVLLLIAVADASYRFVETPLRRRWATARPPIDPVLIAPVPTPPSPA